VLDAENQRPTGRQRCAGASATRRRSHNGTGHPSRRSCRGVPTFDLALTSIEVRCRHPITGMGWYKTTRRRPSEFLKTEHGPAKDALRFIRQRRRTSGELTHELAGIQQILVWRVEQTRAGQGSAPGQNALHVLSGLLSGVAEAVACSTCTPHAEARASGARAFLRRDSSRIQQQHGGSPDRTSEPVPNAESEANPQ
jgi:hypothetical protein